MPIDYVKIESDEDSAGPKMVSILLEKMKSRESLYFETIASRNKKTEKSNRIMNEQELL